jgi:hypothetical protein
VKLFALVSLCAVQAEPVAAQDVRGTEANGPWTGGALGESLASIPDLNGDGVAEFLAGAPFACPDGTFYTGQVLVLSGKDGAVLRSINGKAAQEYLGTAVSSCPDLNGDSMPDILASAESAKVGAWEKAGEVRAYSGKDASLLLTIQGAATREHLGRTVIGIPDVDGDGRGDIVVGVPFANFMPSPGMHAPQVAPGGHDHLGGELRVYSGKDGKPLYVVRPESPRDWTGIALAAVGDCNADGTPDFAFGARYVPEVRICSGKDGRTLRTLPIGTTKLFFGESLSGAPDVNGDGVQEVLVGASRSMRRVVTGGARVVLFSGKDCSTLLEIPEPEPENDHGDEFGCAVAVVGDIDKDGTVDFLVGASCASTKETMLFGQAHVFSGRNSKRLLTVSGEEFDRLGQTVAAAGDLNSDGCPDFVVGSPWAISGAARSAGTVKAFSGKDGSVLWCVSGKKWPDPRPTGK